MYSESWKAYPSLIMRNCGKAAFLLIKISDLNSPYNGTACCMSPPNSHSFAAGFSMIPGCTRYLFLLAAMLLAAVAPAKIRPVKPEVPRYEQAGRNTSYHKAGASRNHVSVFHASHYTPEQPEHRLHDTLCETEEDEVQHQRKHAVALHTRRSAYSLFAFPGASLPEKFRFLYRDSSFVSCSRHLVFGVFRI